MNPVREQFGQGLIDQPMPLNAILAGKSRRDDLDGEVAFAARIMPGMAAMASAVVGHGEPFGGQGGAKPAFDFGRYRPGGSLRH